MLRFGRFHFGQSWPGEGELTMKPSERLGPPSVVFPTGAARWHPTTLSARRSSKPCRHRNAITVLRRVT
jgi:hypothetical protein